MDTEGQTAHHEPWNKGKIVGQKAPFKVKDIWALRVRRKRLAIPPRQTASIHILSSLAHRRFRMRRAPLSTTSAMTVPITKSGYEDPVHATSAPATITPALAITSFAEKI